MRVRVRKHTHGTVYWQVHSFLLFKLCVLSCLIKIFLIAYNMNAWYFSLVNGMRRRHLCVYAVSFIFPLVKFVPLYLLHTLLVFCLFFSLYNVNWFQKLLLLYIFVVFLNLYSYIDFIFSLFLLYFNVFLSCVFFWFICLVLVTFAVFYLICFIVVCLMLSPLSKI